MAEMPGGVWARPERGTRGPASTHTRAELAGAAVRLADEKGLAAVAMRAVARELGTGPASLYRYVASRDELLDLMADAATAEVDLTVPLGGDPVGDLAAVAERTRSVQLRHPWLTELPPERLRLGPRGLDYLEYALRALAPVVLPGRVKVEVIALMNGLVALLVRTELHGQAAERRATQAAYLAEAVARGDRPHLSAALAGLGAAQAAEEDAGELFRRTVRRTLTALLFAGQR